MVAERAPEAAAGLAAAPVARAPAAAYERGASSGAAVPRGCARVGRADARRGRCSAPNGWWSASRSRRLPPIRPPRPSRNCCSTTCCARSASRVGSEVREGRACHLPVDEGQAGDIAAAIEAVRPRCILALGRAAALALLGVDEPLGKLRERLHQRDGIPVVVTFALPYLLRHAADKPRAWADLCRAVAAIA